MSKLYDGKCLNLADHFLKDEPCRTAGDSERLASVIQSAVEDWFDGRNCPHGVKMRSEELTSAEWDKSDKISAALAASPKEQT